MTTTTYQTKQRSSYKAALLCVGCNVIGRCRAGSGCRWRNAGRRLLPQRAEASPHWQASTRRRRRRERWSFRRVSDGRRQSGRREAAVRAMSTDGVVDTRQRAVSHVTEVVVGRHARHSTSMTSVELLVHCGWSSTSQFNRGAGRSQKTRRNTVLIAFERTRGMSDRSLAYNTWCIRRQSCVYIGKCAMFTRRRWPRIQSESLRRSDAMWHVECSSPYYGDSSHSQHSATLSAAVPASHSQPQQPTAWAESRRGSVEACRP